MLIRVLSVASLFVIVWSGSYAQRLKKADKATLTNLQAHIAYLADDKLEGRRAGTKGEKLAGEYISKQFQSIGLLPKGAGDTWFQPFGINEGRQVNSSTLFIIDGNDLKLNTDYFPLAFSPNAHVEAAVSTALAEKGVPWFLDLRNMLEDNKDNPHYDLEAAIREKVNKAAEKGATAMVIFNTSAMKDNLKFNGKDRATPVAIPVLYITSKAVKSYLQDESGTYDVKIRVDIGDKIRTGQNVIGYIDNGAPQTIVLGAHYDHLGFGEDGNSMVPNARNQVHNGADDNASGTAALIELARSISASKNKNNNYLFIAFSAEELGLNGSKYFTQNPTIDLKSVNYMINMDMVGRLNDSSKTLTIGGYGTSPVWGELFDKMNARSNPLHFKFDSSGTGPSDHTSFYRADMPVLFFFTGLHADYHKPSDDPNKINYNGELLVIKCIENLITAANTKGKLAFTKTRETQTSSSARFSVSLGIMPDYTFTGAGVRADGVSDSRPAQKAGIKAGDVIIQLGEFAITSMEGYMQALSQFRKGDSTKVRYKRGNDTLEADITF